MIRINKLLLVAGLIAAFVFPCGRIPAQQDSIRLSVVPDSIMVNALYRGTAVEISADIPEYSAAIIKLEGTRGEMELNRKGRVAIVWLNVAHVIVKNAPEVYLLASSDKIANICTEYERERLGLGYQALKAEIIFSSDKPLTGSEFEEFIELKERSRLYNMDCKIDMEPPAGGRQRMHAYLPVPSIIPPGEYGISLYCFRDGKLVANGSAKIVIEMVGLPNLVTSLAYGHPAVHGILAIAVAILAGIVIGLIFSSRERRRR